MRKALFVALGFQSTHPRRVRPSSSINTEVFSCFNPRTHAGCDSVTDITQTDFTMFQSTHPRRVRLSLAGSAPAFGVFQSTHPRRVRRLRLRQKQTILTFQSTHPRRVRRCRASTARPIRVSIHAPTQGATDYDHYLDHLKAVSIHAPTQGATFNHYISSLLFFVSIHAPTQGATNSYLQFFVISLFQSTHPRRVRQRRFRYRL